MKLETGKVYVWGTLVFQLGWIETDGRIFASAYINTGKGDKATHYGTRIGKFTRRATWIGWLGEWTLYGPCREATEIESEILLQGCRLESPRRVEIMARGMLNALDMWMDMSTANEDRVWVKIKGRKYKLNKPFTKYRVDNFLKHLIDARG